MSVSAMRIATWTAGAVCLYILWKLNADWPAAFLHVFLQILSEALPFLLLGAIVSAALETFITDGFLQGLIPRNRLGGVLFGSLLGLALPLCECGMIPVARRLIRKGMPAYIGIVYIIAGPIVNPIVFLSTLAAFPDHPRMAYVRILLALAVAIAAGLVLALFLRRNPLRAEGETPSNPNSHHHDEHCHHNHSHDHGHSHNHALGFPKVHSHDHDHSHPPSNGNGSRVIPAIRDIIQHAAMDMRDMGKFLLLGAALTAFIQAFLPTNTLASAAGHNTLSHLFLMGFAYLLSLCSTSDAFVAASLSHLFHPGALLAFLVFGPMFDLKSTIMMLSVFRKRFVWQFALLTATLVFVGSLIVEKYGLV